MLALTLLRLSEGDRGAGLWRTAVGGTLGAFLLVIPLFVYYIAYDIRFPFSNNIIPPIVAALLAFFSILASRKLSPPATHISIDWRPAEGAMALILVPLVLALLTPTPAFVEGDDGSLRIVNYNLHMGFDVRGQLGMESLAQVMIENDADVIVLQEVSRGWVINGSLDMMTWLSHRLDMPYIFAPAADPIWGNAILSRYPIEEVDLGALPRGPAAMKRGYVQVIIDYGAPESVRIIGTHLHHVDTDTAIRIPQVDILMDVWDGTERTLIMGDMNARPGEDDIVRYTEAGLLDVYSETGSEDSLTFISSDPYELIDWIFASDDVVFLDFHIPQTTASDHLPLVTTVELP
jgi:endonuclease/exonuclease/phosphatase family metal-dependent hydrolase